MFNPLFGDPGTGIGAKSHHKSTTLAEMKKDLLAGSSTVLENPKRDRRTYPQTVDGIIKVIKIPA